MRSVQLYDQGKLDSDAVISECIEIFSQSKIHGKADIAPWQLNLPLLKIKLR